MTALAIIHPPHDERPVTRILLLWRLDLVVVVVDEVSVGFVVRIVIDLGFLLGRWRRGRLQYRRRFPGCDKGRPKLECSGLGMAPEPRRVKAVGSTEGCEHPTEAPAA